MTRRKSSEQNGYGKRFSFLPLASDSTFWDALYILLFRILSFPLISASLATLYCNLEDKSEGVIASEGSSRYGSEFTITGEDHISIARPNNRATRTFTAFAGLVKDIADDPRHGRPANFQLLPESLVGINKVLKKVKRKLKKTPRLCFVGMGGVGKTTLAMALFNKIEQSYQYTCFIREVKDLQGSQDTKMKVAMLERLHLGGRQWTGKTTDLNFLKGKRLLLVLDDVSLERDLEIVHILGDLVHEDSRFIATSRDPRVVKLCFEEYSGLNLNQTSSRKLFLSYAFPNGSILNETIDKFVNYIIQKCGGLPLTLTVLGKYLHGEEEQIWKETITALENAKKGGGLEEDLWSILKLSYDRLTSKEEKQMFLDASTVFYKRNLSIAMAAWNVITEGVQQRTWNRLVELSLVSEVFEGGEVTISMHDQFLSLGRRMASDPTENSIHCTALWNDSEKALELLSTDDEDMDELKDITALKLCRGELKRHNMRMSSTQGTTCPPENRMSISGRKLQKMKNLQCLWLEDIDIDQMHGSESAPTLSVSSPEIQLPSTLVYVHMSSVNFSGFTFDRKKYYRLAVLEIVRCSGLHQLPETYKLLQGLEHVELQDTSLQFVPDFGKLELLKTLRMSWVRTAKFPCLPECLEEVIRKRNFPGPFHLKIEDGKFVRDYKLNDNVYEIHRPQRPSIEVIFFHGLQMERNDQVHLTTWMSRDGSELWLNWITKYFRDARILVISYDAYLHETDVDGRKDIYLTCENLLESLLDAGVGQNKCPVLLAGHNFGGLMIKELCVKARSFVDLNDSDPHHITPLQSFLHNIKGLFFYVTPCFGSRLADKGTSLSKGPSFEDLTRTLEVEAIRQNEEFQKLRRKYKWRLYGIGISRPTTMGMPEEFTVSEAPGRSDVRCLYTVIRCRAEKDHWKCFACHLSACEPSSPVSRSFGKLRISIRDILNQEASLCWTGRVNLSPPGWSPNAEPLTLLQEEPDPKSPKTMEAMEPRALELREGQLHHSASWKVALNIALCFCGAMVMFSICILIFPTYPNM